MASIGSTNSAFLFANQYKVQQASDRVEQSQRLVEESKTALVRNSDRLSKDRDQYSAELAKSRQLQSSDFKYAVQQGSGTQQAVQPVNSKVTVPKPTVNTSGQTVGSIINITA